MLGVFAAGRILNAKTARSQVIGAMIWGVGGAGACLANAVYNACGVRVRDYPITVEKVLAGLD
jgi:xanthine dehydrogenase YagR molybdenum-binding subunit